MAKVEDRENYLRFILEEYPTLLKHWEEQQEAEFARIAKEDSEGDREIECDIYNSLLRSLDNFDDKKDMFYQSVFLMCYSCYESCVSLLSKGANSKESICAICKTKNITLSEEALKSIDFLQGNMKVLRNNICHNNFGTFRKVDVLKKIAAENIGIDYSNDILSITDPQIIMLLLDKMHIVLHELCEKLSYTTITIKK